MKHSVKLLVCDLDGTLLNDQKQITPRTKAALQRARASGMQLCFATGRYEAMMQAYAHCVGGIDYSLSSNGAVARCVQTQEILFCATMSPAAVARILQFFAEKQMSFMMYTANVIYYLQGVAKLTRRLEEYERLSEQLGAPQKLTSIPLTFDSLQKPYSGVIKMVAYEEVEERLQDFERFVEGLDGVHCESTGYGLLSAADMGASKKTALHAMMHAMGIAEENVCVFGDYTNDLSMFDCAAHRVAVANAVPEVKARATTVTLTNNEDGVARYIETLLGN